MRAVLISGLFLIIQAAGCATTNADGSALTAEQKMVRCAGQATAVFGICHLAKVEPELCVMAALGTCAVWWAFSNEQDKRRMAAARQRALDSGVSTVDEWRGNDGKLRKVSISVGDELPLPDARETGVVCRSVNIMATLGSSSAVNHEEHCRTPDGRWMPRAQMPQISA